MSDTFELSTTKKEILNQDGNILILGGPGSGKTTIALLKAQSIIEKGTINESQKILFLSFARATVSRVEQHAKKIIQNYNTDSIVITTYHAFIWEIIKSQGFLLVPHRIRILLPHDASIKLSNFEGEENRQREKMRLFETEGLLHFDLFAQKCVELLKRSNKIAQLLSNAYPIIIVDEFQDTNQSEWELISHLGQGSCLIALADSQQRIYDFRGASPERIVHYISRFNPTQYDFGEENNRSNGTDIVKYGNDLLKGRNKGTKYNSVKVNQYKPLKANGEFQMIKAEILKRMKVNKNNRNWSLVVLVPTNRLMISISDYLGTTQKFSNGRILPAIQHEVSINLEGVALAANIIAKILEKVSIQQLQFEDFVLDVCEHILGRQGERKVAMSDQNLVNVLKKYVTTRDYSKKIRGEKRQMIVAESLELVELCKMIQLTGDVASDWANIRKTFSSFQSTCLRNIYQDAHAIKLLRKGSTLSSSLIQLWLANGNYLGASDAVKNALTREHFDISSKTWDGINVMTIHKAKGKEFDDVILFEGSYTDRFVVNGDFEKAKYVLYVAITRAKQSVDILTPNNHPCELL